MGTVTITKGPDGSSTVVAHGDGDNGPGAPAAITGANGRPVHQTPELSHDFPFNMTLLGVLGMAFVLLIVLIGMRHEEKKLRLKAAANTPPDDRWRTSVEQRLATLERIATDTGTPLTHQIEALRDDARVNPLR